MGEGGVSWSRTISEHRPESACTVHPLSVGPATRLRPRLEPGPRRSPVAGIKRAMSRSVYILDRPVIVAYLIVIVMLFITINLIVDILYSVIDPRIRTARSEGS